MKLRPFPSDEEQIEAKKYVLERPLVRPNVTMISLLLYVSLYILISLMIGLVFHIIFKEAGIIEKFTISEWVGILFLYILGFFIAFVFMIRIGLILLIKWYQGYAKETTRRKCLCMPTCSEYAILVLKRYGVLIGLFLIRRRLFVICTGNVYKKDPPYKNYFVKVK